MLEKVSFNSNAWETVTCCLVWVCRFVEINLWPYFHLSMYSMSHILLYQCRSLLEYLTLRNNNLTSPHQISDLQRLFSDFNTIRAIARWLASWNTNEGKKTSLMFNCCSNSQRTQVEPNWLIVSTEPLPQGMSQLTAQNSTRDQSHLPSHIKISWELHLNILI